MSDYIFLILLLIYAVLAATGGTYLLYCAFKP